MFSHITYAWSVVKPLIDDNKETIHILVPIGTLVSLYLGWKNSSHLRQQANLQREIEGNRYDLELFEKRFNVFNYYETLDKVRTINENENIGYRITELCGIANYEEKSLERCIFLFKEDDRKCIGNTKLCVRDIGNQYFEIAKKILDNTNYNRELDEVNSDISSRNVDITLHNIDLQTGVPELEKDEDQTLLLLEKRKNELCQLILDNDEDIKCESQKLILPYKKYVLYRELAVRYMKEKLVVPEKAFVRNVSLYGRLKDTLHKRPKHEVIVMYGAVTICILVLGVLLCS